MHFSEKKYNLLVVGSITTVLTIVFVLNLLVDPFHFHDSWTIGVAEKEISSGINPQLYKILEYSRSMKSTIILGDSRGASLHVEDFHENGWRDVYNFSYGGGSLYEALDTFWYANGKTRLERVILVLHFSMYNENNNQKRFDQALQLAESALGYFFSPLVTKASYKNLVRYFRKEASAPTNPHVSAASPAREKDRKWRFHLGKTADIYYSFWKRPYLLRQKLDSVAEYCDRNNIELIIVIPPSHRDLQKKLAGYHLEDEFRSFKQYLAGMKTVYDCDFPNKWTEDRQYFTDPFHFDRRFGKKIVRVITGNERPGTQAGVEVERVCRQLH